MIYVFNKNKIFSYTIASFIVVSLFVFSSGITQNKDVELIKVSSNIVADNIINNRKISNLKQ